MTSRNDWGPGLLRRFCSLACVGVLPLLLAACGQSDVDDLKSWMEQETQGMRGKVEPLPEVKPYEPVVYAAFDLVDPFQESKLITASKGRPSALQPDMSRVREPLEGYDLEKLKMKGTIQKKGRMLAIIETPDAATYSVQVGSFIGQNFGVVISINENGLVLKETVEDSSGEWVERTTPMPLTEQESGK